MGSSSPIPEPELLSPEQGNVPPPPPRPVKPGWQLTPATHLLVGINCLVFVAMLLSRVNAFNPSAEQLLHFGANNASAVLSFGEWSRIVTAMFVHVGIIHLATNMWCLWNLGMLAEPLAGSLGMIAVYVLSGAAGNLLSTLINWYLYSIPGVTGQVVYGPVGAGASGAVFGLAGLLIVLLKSPRLPVPAEEVRRLRKSVIYFAVINFALGIASYAPALGVRIDNMAHLGGFLGGLLFALPMVPRIGSEPRQFKRRLRMAVVLTMGVLVLFGFYLAQLPG